MLEIKVADLKEKLAKSEFALSEKSTKSIIHVSMEDLDSKISDLEIVAAKVETVFAENARLTVDLEAAKTENKFLSCENEIIQRNLEEATTKLETSEKKIEQLEAQNEAVDKYVADVFKEMAHLSETLNSKSADLHFAENQLEALNKKDQELSSHNLKLEMELTGIRDEYEAMEKEVENLKTKNAELQKILAQKESENGRHAEQVAELRDELYSKNADLEAAEVEIFALKKRNTEILGQNEKLHMDLMEAKGAYEDSALEEGDLKEELEDLRKILNRKELDNEKLSTENSDLKALLESKNAELETAVLQTEKFKNDLVAISADLKLVVQSKTDLQEELEAYGKVFNVMYRGLMEKWESFASGIISDLVDEKTRNEALHEVIERLESAEKERSHTPSLYDEIIGHNSRQANQSSQNPRGIPSLNFEDDSDPDSGVGTVVQTPETTPRVPSVAGSTDDFLLISIGFIVILLTLLYNHGITVPTCFYKTVSYDRTPPS